MAFDFGGAIASVLIVGAIYAVFGHGTGFLSQRIEEWKERRWVNSHKHLTPEQIEVVKNQLIAEKAKKSARIWLIIWVIFFGGIGAIIYFARQ